MGCLIIWAGLFKENELPVDLTGDERDERARERKGCRGRGWEGRGVPVQSTARVLSEGLYICSCEALAPACRPLHWNHGE